jgi:hypothetical protein
MNKIIIYRVALASIILVLSSCSKKEDIQDLTLPVAPTELSAKTINFSKVSLNWIDKSTNEKGFSIERKLSTGSYQLIGKTDPNTTSYIDSNLNEKTTYSYRVFSYNTLGASTTYTNEITVQTPRAPGLIAHFPYNNGTGFDLSGNNNSTGWRGVIYYYPDRFGDQKGSIQMPLINDCDKSSYGGGGVSFNTGNDYSISFWFKILNTDKENQTLFNIGTPYNLTSTFNFKNSLSIHNEIGPYNGFFVSGETNTIPIGDLKIWHNFTVTKNSTEIKFYLDGALKKSQKINVSFNASLDTGVIFGSLGREKNLATCYEIFNGAFDDIRIYDKTLNDKEVLEISKN